MGAKVTQAEVIAEVVHNRDTAIRDALKEGRTMLPYSYGQFRKDLRSHDLVVNRNIIRDKWSILVENGTIIESGRWTKRNDDVPAVVVLYRIKNHLSPTYREQLRVNEARNAPTMCGDTHTEVPSADDGESSQPAGTHTQTHTEVGA
ncbi:MAG: hypothetical protein Q4Q62_05370 [Thermoplasmata archaeon]|nr:hypothetical protein [Thermoplasmata archaeon]